ncbi:MAG TPA: hypothetical protein VNH18_25025, partial [Bryobacteraceae bacterium]|nr:hypothetical protein [Bryobacteraceae bacterium]
MTCAILTALIWPQLRGKAFARAEQFMSGVARQGWKTMVFAAALPMLVRVAMLPWFPPPPPQIHDEFSYLLQGDTFAHGRITNPTPPY